VPILNLISTNRAVLLALTLGLNISSIDAAPHEAKKPPHNKRQLQIIQPSSSFVHAVFSDTLGITELQKRFHLGDSSTKDRGQNGGPVFWLSTGADRRSWKENIIATTFWIGEPARSGSPSNTHSAWDSGWMAHYGGEDSPTRRVDFWPTGFTPRQNPFYIALPYSDVSNGHTKPEAAQIIPWFKSSFSQNGRSILKDRWVAIRRGARVCYAQWEDAGPFRTDHWQYVFGNERPLSNQNHDAGIDLSPAVRDFLNIGGMDSVDWKFVEFSNVPAGPWTRLGDNNPFVQQIRNSTSTMVRRASCRSRR
jgi:hypothetical protein